MKKTLLGIMIATMSIFAIGCSKQEAPKEELTAPTETEVIQEAETETETKATEKKVEEQYVKEQLVLIALDDAYEGKAAIDFEKEAKIYTITPLEDELTLEIYQATQGSQHHVDAWNILVEAHQKTSIQFMETLGKGYSLALRNSINPNNTLLLVTDGIVISDCVADGNFL